MVMTKIEDVHTTKNLQKGGFATCESFRVGEDDGSPRELFNNWNRQRQELVVS